ncbi:hypothetical protein CQA49_00850 [Helicobacter sp. MIT 00-7814]|uniref:hypothetical protein n=1 Tax=unclassified Helicobacter TaxID=2593540 RepID=UPI000E1F1647|nr:MULTISPECIES: hypothetical protein [unclassified Helicobacter]RDU55061.1 hypothetical protein CQA37_04440 [Helicobacter sp. MIT 99-10781]RDU56880.1 hypothetical protein CQA49_00850 [Helicobacter sp. MIT 00-7814]
MKKAIITSLMLSLLAGSLQASPQNIANMSDIKEVIQILLTHKKQAEDKLLIIEQRIKSISDMNKDNYDLNEAQSAAQALLKEDMNKLGDELSKIQAAILELDPENKTLNTNKSDDVLLKTYTTQKEFTDFKNLMLGDVAKLRKEQAKTKEEILNQNNKASSAALELLERRLYELEKKFENCGCSIPESEMK